MAPTLRAGEVVYVGGHYTPTVGDVVVFGAARGAVAQVCGVKPGPGEMCPRPTAKESTDDWIKRVVAGPGDTIAMDGGHVILNGTRLLEPYADVSECAVACTYRRAIRIAPGYFFMLGDNRGASDDSRFWGPVPTAWIVGRVERCSAVGVSCRYVR